MGDTIILSGFSIYTLGLVAVFSFLWGSFVFYKKALESHVEENLILDIVVLCSFWSVILGRILYSLLNVGIFYKHWTRIFFLSGYPGVDRWGVVLGLLVGCLLVVRRKKIKYLDLLDNAVLGYFLGVSFFWVGINFVTFYWQSLLIAFFHYLSFLLFWKLEKTYRLISWYRNGKTFAKSGFVSGFGLVLVGFLFILEQLLFKNLVLIESLWVLVLVLGGLALVYIRSGRILVEDIKLLNIWNKKNKK